MVFAPFKLMNTGIEVNTMKTRFWENSKKELCMKTKSLILNVAILGELFITLPFSVVFAMDGALDSGFSTTLNSGVNAIAVQSDGKILIGGLFSSVDGVSRGRIARLLPNGHLDTSFGNGLAGANDAVNAVTVQKDGKILIGGSFSAVNGVPDQHRYVARLFSDGTLDANFKLDYPWEWGGGRPVAIALQEDGNILVGGGTIRIVSGPGPYHGEVQAGLVRLNQNGKLELEFGKGSSVLPLFSGGVNAVALQPDGKILIGGSFNHVHYVVRQAIARLNKDGTLDHSFSNNLINPWVNAIAVQPDGKILIGGTFHGVDGVVRERIARLLPSGQLDTSFGNGLAGANGAVRAITVQTDGKILIGGDFDKVNNETRRGIARLRSDGTLDPDFGGNGLYGVEWHVSAIALQGESTIIGGGFTYVNQVNQRSVARLKRGTMTINPANGQHTSSAVTGTIQVTVNEIPWIATKTSSWITITGGTWGRGNGTVTYSMPANSSISSRSGTITLSGGGYDGGGIIRTFTITQSGSSSAPSISSPAPGSTLTSSAVTFQWTSISGASQYFLYVGTSLGTNNLYSQNQGLNLSALVSSLPMNGNTLYVRLWWLVGDDWNYRDYTYATASSHAVPGAPALLSPAHGAHIAGSASTFSWSAASGSPIRYHFQIGTVSSFSTVSFDSSTITERSLALKGFSNNGTRYYWRVRAFNTSGWGPWSSVREVSFGSAIGDYSGNGKTDLAVFNPANGAWYIRGLTGGTITWNNRWGWATAKPVVGDYDGDGKFDLAVFDTAGGFWYVKSLDGRTLAWRNQWGWSTAIPVPGDYNGDRKWDQALFDRSNGRWFIKGLNGPIIAWNTAWGWSGAKPVSGDYDGDGKFDLAVFDTAGGFWYVKSLDGRTLAWRNQWGWSTARTVPGDYNGDGEYDFAVFDQATGRWFIRNSRNQTVAWSLQWGWAGAKPVSGDFDGDGIFDLAVVDTRTGRWFVKSLDGRVLAWNVDWGWAGAKFPALGE